MNYLCIIAAFTVPIAGVASIKAENKAPFAAATAISAKSPVSVSNDGWTSLLTGIRRPALD